MMNAVIKTNFNFPGQKSRGKKVFTPEKYVMFTTLATN